MLNSVFVLPKLSYDSPRYETVYLDYFDKWLISIRKREGILCQNAWANIYIYIYIYIFLGKQKVSRDQLTLPLKLSYSFYNIVYCLNRTFLSRSARKNFFLAARKCFIQLKKVFQLNMRALNYKLELQSDTSPSPPDKYMSTTETLQNAWNMLKSIKTPERLLFLFHIVDFEKINVCCAGSNELQIWYQQVLQEKWGRKWVQIEPIATLWEYFNNSSKCK